MFYAIILTCTQRLIGNIQYDKAVDIHVQQLQSV